MGKIPAHHMFMVPRGYFWQNSKRYKLQKKKQKTKKKKNNEKQSKIK